MTADLDLVRRLGAAEHGLVVVTTVRPDHTVHASVVNAGVLSHPTTDQPCVGFVVRGDARKLSYLRQSRRAGVVFRSGWEWAGVEGPVELAGPDDQADGIGSDAIAGLLRDIFRAAGGDHEDWAEFDRVMARERRTAVLVEPQRITSNG